MRTTTLEPAHPRPEAAPRSTEHPALRRSPGDPAPERESPERADPGFDPAWTRTEECVRATALGLNDRLRRRNAVAQCGCSGYCERGVVSLGSACGPRRRAPRPRRSIRSCICYLVAAHHPFSGQYRVVVQRRGAIRQRTTPLIARVSAEAETQPFRDDHEASRHPPGDTTNRSDCLWCCTGIDGPSVRPTQAHRAGAGECH